MSRRRILTPAELQKRDAAIAAAYAAGMQTATIAERWRVGVGSVAGICRQQGVPPRKTRRGRLEAAE